MTSDEDLDKERFMLPILLPILFLVGVVCCVKPEFFVKRPGLRLGLLFGVIPEEHRATAVRVLGVLAIFASIIGLIQLIRIW